MQAKYGLTVDEIIKCGYDNIYKFINHSKEESMDISLARTVEGFSNYVNEIKPDLIVVHGDRLEAMAGAIVGSFNNILVAHIEGGEISGTIDELIRHSVSKLCHIHFVANNVAKKRLVQMGESEDTIFEIGSPDVDLMLSLNLPSIDYVRGYYEISFDKYSIVMFHPVTTEVEYMGEYSENLMKALKEKEGNYIIIFPNNDLGSSLIIEQIEKLRTEKNVKIFPSIRFEYFLVLLKNAEAIIGNSSAGIREAPYYSLPTINIGTRQNNRAENHSIINTGYSVEAIIEGFKKIQDLTINKTEHFGNGNSDKKFIEQLKTESFWKISKQKMFNDI